MRQVKQFRKALRILPATFRGPPHTLVTSQPIGATVDVWADTEAMMEIRANAYESLVIVPDVRQQSLKISKNIV